MNMKYSMDRYHRLFLCVAVTLVLGPYGLSQTPIAGPYIACAFPIGDVDKDSVPDYYADYAYPRYRGTAYSGKTQRRLYTSTVPCQGRKLSNVISGYDVNADGFPDLIEGRPYGGFSSWANGSIRVYSGKDGTLLRTQFGKNKGDGFGYAICFVGDVNNDKYDDYAVSIPHGLNTGSPETNVYSGNNGARIAYVGIGVTDPINHLRLLGDINKDGKVDFLATSLKRVYVYSLSTKGYLKRYAISIPNDSPVDAGLDVNNDGAPDFVYGYRGVSTGAGTAWVYSAKDGKLLHKFSGTPKANLGAGVALIQDLNGDGHADILVGAPKGIVPQSGNAYGSVQAFSGRTGELLLTIAEPNYSKRVLGTGISVIGDITGDKIPEVAIPRADGVYIYDLQLGGGYGQGCASTVALPTLRADLPPRIGGTFRLVATNLLTSTSGALIVGASDKTWGSIPLPLDLGAMGARGCQLYCSVDILTPFTTTTGSVTFNFTMPTNYSLLGIPVFEQLWARDARANPTGIATTNGVRNRLRQ